ncbi:MAG: DUF2249 domain-containing protein [Halobacterium sp.]
MPSALDVREDSHAARRDRVFDRLDATDPGETVEVTSDRDPRPSLSQYRIARGAALDVEYERRDGDDWAVRVTHRGDSDADVPEFDVRDLPPMRRHEVLTDTFDRLAPGDAFVLVNDHDPEPLYHELKSTHGDVVGWEYAARDPGEWRVEVAKTGESTADDSGAAATFDVREIPKADRHPTIHHRYGNLRAGEALDVVAPHEPAPLRREFRQRYGDGFEWDVRERDADRCRVRITKTPDGARDADGTGDEAASGGEESNDAGAELTVTDELDVRDRPPAERHERIYDAYDALEGGEAFVLVNDHDPKPLYHQFEAEAGAEFRWTYLSRDPGEFRVRIGKAESGDPATSAPEDVDAPF